MATAISVVDNFIREELPSVIHESLPTIAPIYTQIEQSSIDVKRNVDIGRGWVVTHLFGTGVAGLMEYANPNGPGFLQPTGKQATQLLMGDAATDLAPFPTAADSPHTGSIKRQLQLHMVTGNFSIPVTWLQSDTLSATQIKQVARDIKAVGELRAMIEAASFFSTNVTAHSGFDVDVLGAITAAAEKSSTNYVKLTLDEQYGRISNFRVGMAIDIVADSSGTLQDGIATNGTDRRNYAATGIYVHLLITDVDYLAKTVTIVGVNDTTGAVATFDSTDGWYGGSAVVPASGDWLVLKNCSTYVGGTRPMCSWGLEDWMKGSGTIMGGTSGDAGLDLDVFSQFKSQVIAVNGPLTDSVMNNYIGGYLDSYPGQTLDTIITTQGVTLKYLEQPALYNNRMVYDRTGKTLKLAGGWSDVSYSFNGRDLRWIVSPMCLTKHLYACKMGGGNIKRYVPPHIGGSDSTVGSEIQFLGPISGHSGIFMNARDGNGAVQNFVEAPFWQYKLIAPVDVRGVKLTNLTEAVMV